MIVNRVYDYLDGKRTTITDEALDLATSLIKRSFNRNFGPGSRKGIRMPSPSSKWGCGRRMFWDADKTIEREPVTARSLITFTLGDMVEQMGVILARQAMGDEITSPSPETGEQREVERLFGDYLMKMHIDMTFADPAYGEVPVDWKSMSERSWHEFKAAATDPDHKWWAENADSYVAQVRFYMMGMYAPRGYLVGVNKNTGHLAEVEVADDPAENDRLARKVIEINQAIRLNALPARPDWAAQPVQFARRRLPDGTNGPGLELNMQATPGFTWNCSYCPYTTECFPGFSVVAMQKPVYRKAIDPADID